VNFRIEVFSFLSLSAIWQSSSATMVLSTKIGPAIEADEGTILNSNLFPVNAKGEVLFLSVASLGRTGSVVTPIFSGAACFNDFAPPLFSICSEYP